MAPSLTVDTPISHESIEHLPADGSSNVQDAKLSPMENDDADPRERLDMDKTAAQEADQVHVVEDLEIGDDLTKEETLYRPAEAGDVLTHTIHVTDDPSLPAVTFRSIFLGISLSVFGGRSLGHLLLQAPDDCTLVSVSGRGWLPARRSNGYWHSSQGPAGTLPQSTPVQCKGAPNNYHHGQCCKHFSSGYRSHCFREIVLWQAFVQRNLDLLASLVSVPRVRYRFSLSFRWSAATSSLETQ